MSIQRVTSGVLGGVLGFFSVVISLMYLPRGIEMLLGRGIVAYSLMALAIALLVVAGSIKLRRVSNGIPEALLRAPRARQMFATFVVLGVAAGLLVWSNALLRPRFVE